MLILILKLSLKISNNLTLSPRVCACELTLKCSHISLKHILISPPYTLDYKMSGHMRNVYTQGDFDFISYPSSQWPTSGNIMRYLPKLPSLLSTPSYSDRD